MSVYPTKAVMPACPDIVILACPESFFSEGFPTSGNDKKDMLLSFKLTPQPSRRDFFSMGFTLKFSKIFFSIS